MKDIHITIFEVIITIIIVIIGLTGKKVFFIENARSATITLGVIGMLFCIISVGKFITLAPAHPLSILGYIIGTIGLIALLAQVFKWNIPYVAKPETALIILAVVIVLKSIIARVGHLLVK